MIYERISVPGISFMETRTNDEGEEEDYSSMRELHFLRTDENEILLSFTDWETEKDTELGYIQISTLKELADRVNVIWPIPEEEQK